MREVATTLTDYLLTVLCTVCVWRLVATGAAARLRGAAIFFAGFAAASFFGGSWHGFFSAGQGFAQQLVWWLSTLFAGVAAAGLALTGLELLGVTRERPLIIVMCVALAIYAVITWHDTRFLVPLIGSLAGTLLCVAGLVRHLRSIDSRGAWLVLAALALSLLAAIAQQQGIALHPPHFDHNATYHIALIPALGLVYAGIRLLAASQRSRTTPLPEWRSRLNWP